MKISGVEQGNKPMNTPFAKFSDLSRREWLRSAGALMLGSASRPKPNILFLVADDLNDWLGVLNGHPQVLTPCIDALARRGVTFRQAYCQAPMCNPSRVSLLTGLRPTTSAVYDLGDLWREALPDAVTLPQHFLRRGYNVLGGGKVFHGNMNEAASWQAYYNFEGFLYPEKTPANGIPNSLPFDWSPIDVPDEWTADTKLALWAAEFLKRRHDRPFFLACGFCSPHLPWYAPRRYFDKFPPGATLLPPFLENDLDDVPKSACSPGAMRQHDNVMSTGQWKNAVAAYLANINYLDTNVGRVLRALQEGPHYDSTIIVLWSDNGFHLGEKRHWRKFTLWERSCRVPLIVVAPGVTRANQFCDRTVELLDLYPTLLELSGLPAKAGLEGASLAPLLRNPAAPRSRPAITSNGHDQISIRTARWRYSRLPDGEELYDHDADPNEWYNLAGRRQYRELKQKLASLLPTNVSRKQVKQWSTLSMEEKRLVNPPPGRRPLPGQQNDVGLKPTL
jgi:arylsulfatase A-like enzyme